MMELEKACMSVIRWFSAALTALTAASFSTGTIEISLRRCMKLWDLPKIWSSICSSWESETCVIVCITRWSCSSALPFLLTTNK